MQAIKTISYTILIMSVLGWSNTLAQDIKSLKIKDYLPDKPIINVMNNNADNNLLPSQLYKNGLLIINFWATWCEPCQREMQMMAQVLNKYNGKVNMLCVGYESKAIVSGYLTAHPELAKSKLIYTSDDKYFLKLFFHQALPHNVWIDNSGIVKAITSGDELSEKNISAFLSTSDNSMYEKKETPFNYFKPMHIPDSLIEFRSIFNKSIPGVVLSGSVVGSSKFGYPHMKRFFCFNNLITNLFYKAYQMPGLDTNPYLMEIQTRDSSKYFWPGQEIEAQRYFGITQSEWARRHVYSYELRTGKPVADSIFFKHVINDLELNLDVKSSLQLKPRNVVKVSCPTSSAMFRHFEAADTTVYLGIVKNEIIIKNISVDRLLDWITEKVYKKPINGVRVSPRIEPYLATIQTADHITAKIQLGNDETLFKNQLHIEKCLSQQLDFKFQFTKDLYPVLVLSDLK